MTQIGSNLALPAIADGELIQLLPETAVRSFGLFAIYPSRRFTPRKVSLCPATLIAVFGN